MEIAIYGGLDEIGGNKIFVRSKECGTLFLDFGRSYSREDSFFESPYLEPKVWDDYIKTDLLPPIAVDLIRRRGEEFHVLISHAHTDHFGYLRLLRDSGARIYLGKTARTIIEAHDSLSRDKQIRDLPDDRIVTFSTGVDLEVGGYKVRPVHVDHSIPGAYGFVVECGSKRLAYTGDMRLHGSKPSMTEDFIEEAGGVDLMLMEATKVAPENDPEGLIVRLLESRLWYRWGRAPPKRISFEVSNEEEVKEKMSSIIEDSSDSLILVELSATDVDRVRSVFEAARKSDRRIVIDERIAFMLDRLADEGIEGLPRLGEYDVLRRRRLKGDEEVKVGAREAKEMRSFIQSVEDRFGEDRLIWGKRRRELLRSPGGSVVMVQDATRFLYDIPRGIKPRIEFILSQSEPFNEGTALSMDRLMNWLLLYDVRRYYRIHVSGHLHPWQIGDVIERIAPRRIVPIHTEHRDLFDVYVPHPFRGSVLLPRVGENLAV